jgi:catechol 2,3-dioxygenase-like lactoylglutathione lyase family enzyme
VSDLIGAIEHIGVIVDQPVAMAEWYKRVLGFDILFANPKPGAETVFLRDSAGRTVVEFCAVPGAAPLAARADHPLQLHLAFASDAPEADAERLVGEGAVFLERCASRPGDTILALKDPWGNTIQLARRAPGQELV